MLYKDLPERIQKIALKERKRLGYTSKIDDYDDVMSFFSRGETRQGGCARSEVCQGTYTTIDKRIDMKNMAKGNRKPIGIKYRKLPKEVQNILVRFDIKFNDKLNNNKAIDSFTLLELIDFEKSKIPRDIVEKANIGDYTDILEWQENNYEYKEFSFNF